MWVVQHRLKLAIGFTRRAFSRRFYPTWLTLNPFPVHPIISCIIYSCPGIWSVPAWAVIAPWITAQSNRTSSHATKYISMKDVAGGGFGVLALTRAQLCPRSPPPPGQIYCSNGPWRRPGVPGDTRRVTSLSLWRNASASHVSFDVGFPL